MKVEGMTRQIHLSAFNMNVVSHISSGLWRHPDNQSWRYKDIRYWTELAQLLERGRFDSLFIADVLGTYDVYGGTHESALKHATQVPVNDPLLLVSAMAAATEHLGFGVTAGTAYEHPYPFARRLSTLDHLSNGRIGWNVVTGYLPSAARNLGHDDQREHDDRYDHADEYMEVLYKLWEGSWEDDAVVADRLGGIYVDPTKVHGIEHTGKHFKVPGIALTEPSPQRTPVIYQAGASERGVRFAAENAEAIFVGATGKTNLAQTVSKIRDALEAAGRGRYSARIYAALAVITDKTAEGAREKHRDYLQYVDEEAALVLMSGLLGIDFSQYDLDEPIGNVTSNAIQSAVASFQSASDDGREWTIRDIAKFGGIGGLGPSMVGSGVEIADKMQEWVTETDVDGFNLVHVISPGTYADVIDHVVPELQKRGAYQLEYTGTSLRDNILGLGDRLPAEHRGATYRRAPLSS